MIISVLFKTALSIAFLLTFWQKPKSTSAAKSNVQHVKKREEKQRKISKFKHQREKSSTQKPKIEKREKRRKQLA
jgi:Flp pilus assembly protein TadB